ncbi:putative diguanylate cyclase AdrA [Fundidesulfovibrio magnetotacticus]|uniref:diguanylate cyclase n=1 Tax=Fundidesulfovibrio magnetotacticus TaxID=2730080 RepID=A0A6V8LNV7_9BACT|nr:sensor domain-containing diguanylate cyclase [Fundidesulfovibrio magnetotacticus]GFK93384.1 putative diguanylate cyclase AdrA [Fundidesulfovibrio magnetotacticus]
MNAAGVSCGPFDAMDFLPMGILVLEEDFTVSFWNACLESWTGLSREEVLGRDARQLFPQLGRPLVTSRIRELFRGAPPAVFSYHLHNHLLPARLPDGSLRLQHSVAYGVPSCEAQVRHVVLSLQDVTEIHNRLQENLRVKLSLEQEVKRRKRVEAKLRELVTQDILTGIANRRAFLHTLHREVRRCRRHGHALSVAVLDLDHFKAINDHWGHLAGDDALKTFVRACSDELRGADTFGRLGGEEFGLILPETDMDGAQVLAGRILERVRAISITWPGGTIRFTVSLGLAELAPEDTLETLFLRADQAMYQAKAKGRDRVERA